MKKRLCIFMAAVMLILCMPMAGSVSAASVSDMTVKVGLFYGTDALPAANLANEVGSGYRFGFFGSTGDFTELGYTYEEKITVLKDKTLWYSGGYKDEKPSNYDFQVGAYHIQLDEQFYSFEEAADAAAMYENAFPAYYNGSYVVRIDNFSTYEYASAELALYGAASVVGNSENCFTVVITGTDTILFEFECNGERFGIYPDVFGNCKSETWFKGYKYNGGFEYMRAYGNDVTVINCVDIEDYVMGVIPYEMSASWPIEALKAQAICARSYAIANIESGSHANFDLCNSTDCQVYRGVYSGSCEAAVREAALATEGLCIYYNGNIATAYFHASDGGATEDAKNVWGSEVPYLKGVIDNFEDLTVANKGIWSCTYTADQLTWLLQQKGYNCANIVDCFVRSYTAVGNVYEVVMVDSNGKEWSFKGDKARTIFYSSTLGKEANSIRYTINGGSVSDVSLCVNPEKNLLSSAGSSLYAVGADGVGKISGNCTVITANGTNIVAGSSNSMPSAAVSGMFTLSGTGWGHNVGMSQQGAKGMAEQGYTYDEIVNFYFTGVSIY